MRRYVITLTGDLVHDVVSGLEVTNIFHMVKVKHEIASKCNEVLKINYNGVRVNYMPFDDSESVEFILKVTDEEARDIFESLAMRLKGAYQVYLYKGCYDSKSHVKYDELVDVIYN